MKRLSLFLTSFFILFFWLAIYVRPTFAVNDNCNPSGDCSADPNCCDAGYICGINNKCMLSNTDPNANKKCNPQGVCTNDPTCCDSNYVCVDIPAGNNNTPPAISRCLPCHNATDTDNSCVPFRSGPGFVAGQACCGGSQCNMSKNNNAGNLGACEACVDDGATCTGSGFGNCCGGEFCMPEGLLNNDPSDKKLTCSTQSCIPLNQQCNLGTTKYTCCATTQPNGIYATCQDVGNGVSKCQYPGTTNSNLPTYPPEPSSPPPPCLTLTPHGGCASVDSGLGVINTDPSQFVTSIFGILMSLSGGIAIIIIMYAGYRIIMSQGDPEKIQSAKELLTAAIVGLFFLIFSFVILSVIGVDVLHLPGFSG